MCNIYLEISIDNFGIITRSSLCFIGELNFTEDFFVFNFPIENNKVLLLFAFYYSFTLPRYPLTKTRKSEYTTNLFYKVMGNTSDPNLIFFFFKVQRILSSFLLLKLYEMVNQPLESPSNPHFFQPLLPGFDTHLVRTTLSVFSSVYVPLLDSVLVHFAFCGLQTIPVAFFSKYIERKNKQRTAKLRSDASDRTWEVKIEGMRLTGGWKDFTTAHDLRIGDVIIFKHEGDMVFNVTPLGPSCCEIQYTQSLIIKEEADSTDDDDEDDSENHQKISKPEYNKFTIRA